MGLLESNRSKSHGKQHAVRFQAATTQLDLAITFYLIAAATRDQDRSDRAIANAEQAYANAASSLDCNLKAGQNLEIEEKLVRLNSVRAGCPANALFLSSSLNERGAHGTCTLGLGRYVGRATAADSPARIAGSCRSAMRSIRET